MIYTPLSRDIDGIVSRTNFGKAWIAG